MNKLFTKSSAEKDKKKNKKSKLRGYIPGLKGVAVDTIANTSLYLKLRKDTSKNINSKESKLINDYLTHEKPKSITVYEKSDPLMSGYHPKLRGPKGTPKFNLALGKNGDQAITAHELGHAHYMEKRGLGAGKMIHYASLPARYMISPLASGIIGTRDGYKDTLNRYKGKKTSKWKKYRSAIIPVAMAVPIVGSEALASVHGYKRLKRVGASKSELKHARNIYIPAGLSYVTKPLGAAYAGVSGYNRGKNIAIKEIKSELKKKYPKLSDKELDIMIRKNILGKK